MKRLLVLTLMLLTAVATMAAQEHVLTGTIRGADGSTPPTAVASLVPIGGGDPVVTGTIDTAGAFTLVTYAEGLHELRIDAPGHLPVAFAVLLDTLAEQNFSVRLAARPWLPAKKLDTIRVIGDFNGFNWEKAQPLAPDSLGHYTLELRTQSPKVRYQFIGLTRDEATAPSVAEGFAYDVDRGYSAVAAATNGLIRIELDPASLVRSDSTMLITASDTQRQELARIYVAMLERRQLYAAKLARHQAAGRPLSEFSYDWKSTMRAQAKRIAKEKDSLVSEMLLISYLDLLTLDGARTLDAAVARRAVEQIRPESPFWAINPRIIPATLRRSEVSDSVADAYFKGVIEQNADPTVVASLLYDGLTVAYTAHDYRAAKVFYERLTSDYASTRFAAIARNTFAIPDEIPEEQPQEFHDGVRPVSLPGLRERPSMEQLFELPW